MKNSESANDETSKDPRYYQSRPSRHSKNRSRTYKEERKPDVKLEIKSEDEPETFLYRICKMKLWVILGFAVSLLSLTVGSVAVFKGMSLFSDRQKFRMNINDKQRQLDDLRERNLDIQQKLSDVSVQLYEELNKHEQLLEESNEMQKQLEFQQRKSNGGSDPLMREHRNSQLSSKKSCQAYLFDTDKSGVYTIAVGKINLRVYCDMEEDDGGWMVIQRRYEGLVDFYQDFERYEDGFGDLYKEYWLGLRYLHILTSEKLYELRIDMEDWEGNKSFAKYRHFAIGNRQTNYKLTVSGYYGDAGDSLSYHNNRPFSAKNRDNDAAPTKHCAKDFHGAWWFGACHTSDLNGEFLRKGQESESGIIWWIWKKKWYSLKRTEMKIRPR